MDTEELIELWKEQDPELENIDGLRAYIESRAPLNIIIIDKKYSQGYNIITALRHLTGIGDITLIFDDFEMLVNVKGNATGNFTVPIPAYFFSQYDISEAIELTDIVTAKLFKMLSETKKNADQIEINTTPSSIYIYATFDSGSKFSYEIDIDASELSLNHTATVESVPESVLKSVLESVPAIAA